MWRVVSLRSSSAVELKATPSSPLNATVHRCRQVTKLRLNTNPQPQQQQQQQLTPPTNQHVPRCRCLYVNITRGARDQSFRSAGRYTRVSFSSLIRMKRHHAGNSLCPLPPPLPVAFLPPPAFSLLFFCNYFVYQKTKKNTMSLE